MTITKHVSRPRRARRRILAVAGVSACAVSAGLLTAAPANADSRGFVVTNDSNATLRLEGLNRQHEAICNSPVRPYCTTRPYPIDFEGHPQPGTALEPGSTQRFDLKWDLFSSVGYKAQLTYKVEHTNAKLEIWIETTRFSNNSRCEVVPRTAGSCTAGGLGITFMQ